MMKDANRQKCSIKRMLPRNHKINAIDQHHTARREEKKRYTRKKKEYNEEEFKELQYLRPMNKGNGFYGILNKAAMILILE